MARSTIGRGLKELDAPVDVSPNTVRRQGSGRRPLAQTSPKLLLDLRELVEPATVGDPIRPLLWVSKSLRKLVSALGALGHKVSPMTVRKLLRDLGFRRQGNRKTKEGASHPDRDAQFTHINVTALSFIQANQPVISVDTKKKELVGDFKNAGTDYSLSGQPEQVRVHDFMDKDLGKVVPHGVYDIAANAGWVTVGIDHDTAEFAVSSIGYWWAKMGRERYPSATRLMITADGGGSNGSRSRLWKHQLQRFADETGLDITVCHYPPGTSKWNKIEHRLFCHISQNWRGKPLTNRLVVIELIGATATNTGLVVRCELDLKQYPTGTVISDQQMKELNIEWNNFHPDWNYTIKHRTKRIKKQL